MRVLLLEYQASDEALRAALREVADWLLIVRLEPGLGGVWTEFEGEQLIHRIGFPTESNRLWFQVMQPQEGKETCAKMHLERIAFSQKISDVVTNETVAIPVIAHALAGHDLKCWFAGRDSAPSEFAALAKDQPSDWQKTVEALKESRAEASS
ncbi:hypothetical protein KQI84_10825 [bacterium]|nr:hypothetical protein [bacterium]